MPEQKAKNNVKGIAFKAQFYTTTCTELLETVKC